VNYLSITNFNFNSVNDYESLNLIEQNSRIYGHKHQDDKIIFEANFVACPCIYYVRQDDLFCFSFDVDQVVEFAQQHNIPLTDTYDNLKDISDNIRSHIKSSIMKRYKYNINYIEKWKKVTLDNKGNFKIEENNFIPFQLEIKYNYSLFKKWVIKYKKLVTNLINKNKFIPTITAGLDTRALTAFYRDRIKDINYYYLTAIKGDGKNNVNKGLKEVEIADKVAKKIGLLGERVEFLNIKDKEYITLSGQFNENINSYDNPNDPDWIYKFLQHAWGNTSDYRYDYQLLPFLDDDWLIFKQDFENKELQRCLFMLLFASDILHIPFISGARLFNVYTEGAFISVVLKNNLKAAIEILDYWGEEKINNIFKED